ncbi:hypothetical protein FBQ87_10830 [Sphingobacteriales bacterium CHB3]|nr:hypothetical protein [Sphingobacteriales bacterium CHB3]
MQKTLAVLPHPSSQPADERDAMFWHSLAMNVQRDIRGERKSRTGVFSALVDRVRSFVAFRPAYVYSAGAALAVMGIAVFFFRPQFEAPIHVAEKEDMSEEARIIPTANESHQRISDYFRKSKTLLVGIANMRTEDEPNIDLSDERSVSRSLVHEARLLQQQPLDGRSARLIRDLEKIMIELANLEETNDLPNVELIRSGIRQENLLFKIRMAAASYDTSQSSVTDRIY